MAKFVTDIDEIVHEIIDSGGDEDRVEILDTYERWLFPRLDNTRNLREWLFNNLYTIRHSLTLDKQGLARVVSLQLELDPVFDLPPKMIRKPKRRAREPIVYWDTPIDIGHWSPMIDVDTP